MHKLIKIAKMEFRRTAMNKVFVLLTICGPLLICSVAILPGVLASSGAFGVPGTVRIAVLGADQRTLEALRIGLLDHGVVVMEGVDAVASVQADLRAGSIDGYLAIPEKPSEDRVEFVSKNTADFRTRDLLESALGGIVRERNFAAFGIGASDAKAIMRPVVLKMSHAGMDGETIESPDFIMIFTSSLIFASLLYLTIVFYGQAVGRSVLMEKTNKTVEILLSSVRPLDILFGKILGNAVASLLQYGIWIISSIVLLAVIGPSFGFSPAIALPAGIYLYLVLYFVLAYFLYCSIYATLGAACRDEQQLAQMSFPVIILLIVPIMLLASIIASPRSPVVVILSLFPLTAPIVMFIRILLGGASALEIMASVFLLVAAIAGCTALSAGIFKSCILLNGKTLGPDLFLSLLRGSAREGNDRQ